MRKLYLIFELFVRIDCFEWHPNNHIENQETLQGESQNCELLFGVPQVVNLGQYSGYGQMFLINKISLGLPIAYAVSPFFEMDKQKLTKQNKKLTPKKQYLQ